MKGQEIRRFVKKERALLKNLSLGLGLAICLTVMLSGAARAADAPGAGFVKNVSGAAFIERSLKTAPAKVKDLLQESDVLVTGPDGSMGVILQDNSVLSIGANTRLVISRFLFKPAEEKVSFIARITKGKVVYLTGLIAKLDRNAVRFETPSTVCGVRGTHFAIAVREEEF
ncbi:MAG: FecR domain-containing protein [Deltaproteobacteria bacterium]|nr:FecR domain-containing protein [Deltaproteobacteria bacterium]